MVELILVDLLLFMIFNLLFTKNKLMKKFKFFTALIKFFSFFNILKI